MRCLTGFVFVLALGLLGCSDTNGTGGTAGDGGSGGSDGGPIVRCLPTEDRCVNRSGATEAYEPCCEQTVPDQENACDGTESIENPATCTPTGNAITYRLTTMEVEGDCDVGYDLDGCDGRSCLQRGPVLPDGLSGVDNALAEWGALLEGIGENLDLGPVNQGLSDVLCGATDDRTAATCSGGENDGSPCTRNDDCPGPDSWCDRDDNDCLLEITPVEILFVIDANPNEGCANATVLTGGEASAQILNLSDGGCASGTLGTIPLQLSGNDGTLANTAVRMTVSSAGFSHGQLGAAIDADLAVAFVELLPIADFMPGLDISGSTPPTRDTSAWCDALSATFVIGGVAE